MSRARAAKVEPKPETIVAEVTKNWPETASVLTDRMPPGGAVPRTLSGRFEQVIAVNHERGYQLESWQLAVTSITDQDGHLGTQETIIAVFRRGRRKS